MHTEEFHISGEVAGRLEQALSEKRGIIAVGTTTVRTLESAYRVDLTGKGKIQTGWQKTNIFIYPGYEFKVISEMFTNFHTPASSLLLLVSAFAGVEFVKEAYQTAIGEQYHFFSYGDAMLIQ
jgi:S-adenosylmethionine:tRNA ribosyltransferase-isomerase